MCHPLHITVGALIHRVFDKQMHDTHRDGYFALEAVLTEKQMGHLYTFGCLQAQEAAVYLQK